jgi:putative holliday junction resolvase
MTSDKQPPNPVFTCATMSELVGQLASGQRLMGLDVGEKTIGMAVSDALLSIATPTDTIRRSKFTKDLEALEKMVKDRNIGGFVIGYPINMNGTEGPRCQSIRQFARNLHQKLGLPYYLWDERMSSQVVERMMTQGGLSRSRRAELVDKLAASYILQGALDTRR